MYPRVRVRGPEDQASQQDAASYLLRVIESLSLEGHGPTKTSAVDHGSKGNIYPDRLNAAISRKNSKDSLSVPKGKSIKVVDEDNRSNATATSVPRPRAVLSSPVNSHANHEKLNNSAKQLPYLSSENDGIIGNLNKRIQERGRPAKRQASDSTGMTDRHNPQTRERKFPSTQRLYKRIQANSSHQDQRAEKPPCTLDNHHNPEPDDGDVKVEKQPLKICMHTTTKPLKICMHTPPKPNHSNVRIESSFKKSVSSKAGAISSCPKMQVFRVVEKC